MGSCCLREEEHWGEDGVYETKLCRSKLEINFYAQSVGWNEDTKTWTNPIDPTEYIILECLGGINGYDGEEITNYGDLNTESLPIYSGLVALKNELLWAYFIVEICGVLVIILTLVDVIIFILTRIYPMTGLVMGTVALGISTWIAVRTTDYANEKNYVLEEDSHTEGQTDRDPIIDKYF